ncbi:MULTISPECIES: helix-turn-helix domain-containing protein [unclassified Mycobacterium]|uniref:helix-turn-helix domain-containing protein n=1 Tax=unclassified Mycobacterium TaxID=2642494 RepID=UPI003876BC69
MASRGAGKPLGDRVKDARVEAGLTLRGVAKSLGLSPSYLNDIEYNRRTPSDDALQKISALFGLDLDELLAAAGRVGISKDAEQYIRENPSAGVLFRRVTNERIPEAELKKLIEAVDELKRDRGLE